MNIRATLRLWNFVAVVLIWHIGNEVAANFPLDFVLLL